MTKYGKVAATLHWVIAILVVTNFILINMAEGLKGPARGAYMMPHFSIGITILLLSLFRLFWRIGHKPPPLPEAIPGWQRSLGRLTHALFYFLIIAVPLTGWLMVSASPKSSGIEWFGLIDATLPTGKSESIAGFGHDGHEFLTKPLFFLILLHVLGALKHQFVDRLPFIQRIFP